MKVQLWDYQKQKIKFMFIFGTEQPLRESLKNYHDKLKKIIDEGQEIFKL